MKENIIMTGRNFWVLIVLVGVFISGCKKNSTDRCGDGVLDPGEECDGTETIAEQCQDLGYYEQNGDLVCKKNCSLDTSVCFFRCGDGLIQADVGEICDRDNLRGESCQSLGRGNGTLACRSDCKAWDFSGCEIKDLCGNMQVDDGEECDGENLADQTCETLEYRPGALACRANCLFDVSGCGGRCGDGIIQEEHEQCDTDNVGNVTCRDFDKFTGRVTCRDNCSLDGAGCMIADSIAPGMHHTCAHLHTSWKISCWGDNTYGQLGNGTQTDSLQQVVLEDFDGVGVVSSGYHHTCAVVNKGGDETSVFCWGRNLEGQLGNGLTEDSSVPVEVQLPENIVDVSTNYNSTCALGFSGKVWCWGNNEMGQLGNNSTVDSFVPVEVELGSHTATAMAVGQDFACVITDQYKILCWGNNATGKLAQDHTLTHSAVPVEVELETGFVFSLVAGCNHACVIRDGSRLYCWGDRSPESSVEPEEVNMGYVATVAAGCYHTCALGKTGEDPDNRVYCWGLNQNRQAGQPTGDRVPEPTAVDIPTEYGIMSVHAGWDTSCALLKWDPEGVGGESAFCWGANGSGELGNQSTTDRSLPVEVLP